MTDEMWRKLKPLFVPSEFDNLCLGSSNKMDPVLMVMLHRARKMAGVAFPISSAFRDPDHNAAAGGADNSAHTQGKAVDIRCHDSRTRFLMKKALYGAGFRRIGQYDRHIHVDVDDSLPQDVEWTGKSTW